MSFESFINDTSPRNNSEVSVSWNEIRNTIESNSDIVSSSFLAGSYIRRTKIHPIDDLDIFFHINFSNTRIQSDTNGTKICLKGDIDSHQLKKYSTNELGTYYVSPIKLINHIGTIVKESYTTTNEQHRNGECYTVYLSSKLLTIDCVPYAWVNEHDYMLIPSGWKDLYWKKTNPKIDKDTITDMDATYQGKLRWVIKIMKFWNKNKNTWVKFKSYILECLVYFAFKNKCNVQMSYLQLLFHTVSYIHNNVVAHRNIHDLPEYQYMYYTLEWDQRTRVLEKLTLLISYINSWEEYTISYLTT